MKFTDKIKSRIVGIGNIGKNDYDLITNVMLVEVLTHNLLSISQFFDQGYRVVFEPSQCIIKDSTSNKIILTARRHDNTYVLYLDDLLDQNVKRLAFFVDEKWLWHKKLGHTHMKLISEISQKELVKGLPKINFENDLTCEFCLRGKEIKSSFQSKNVISITKLFELLHLDLFGLTRTTSLGGKKYSLVIVDNFSIFT